MYQFDLATPFGSAYLPNGTKLAFSRPIFDDGDAELGEPATCKFTVFLRSNNATAVQIAEWPMVLTDTESDAAERQLSPAVGKPPWEIDRYIIRSKRATPTGYSDAHAAWKAGNNANQRRAAFVAHLFAAGHLHASLAASQ